MMGKASRWMLIGVLGASSLGCEKVKAIVRDLTGGGSQPAGQTTAQPAQGGGGGGGGSEQAPAQDPQSSVETPSTTRATGCPASLANGALAQGTLHRGELHRDETWTLEGSPHRLPNGFSVLDSATLTIAPCAVVLVGNGHGIHVRDGGGIVAIGDAQHPIRIGSSNPQPQPGDWQSVWVDHNARRNSRLSHVIIEHAGSDWDGVHAGLTVLMPNFQADHVTLRANRGFGIALRDEGTFATTASDLTVTGTVAEGSGQTGALYVQRAPSVGSVPPGTYTGNAVDEVFIAEAAAASDTHTIRTSTTWRNVGIPYHLADDQDLRVDGPTGPVLTIAAGVTIRFGRNAGVSVGYEAEGGLVADGASEATRITFKQAGNDASPGQWHGIYFGSRYNRSGSRLRFVSIHSAGTAWSSQLCDWEGANSDSSFVYFEAEPTATALDHVAFLNGAPNVAAIARQWRGNPVDFASPALGLDFANFGPGCHQSPVPNADGACPDPAPRCQ